MCLITMYLILTLTGFTTDVDSSRQGFYWREWKPGDSIVAAVVAGLNRYVGRVKTRRGTIVAMIGLKKNVAVAIVDRKEIFERGIEILCARSPNEVYWEDVDFRQPADDVLDNAIRGGYQENIKSELYIGRARHPSRYKVGKVVPPGKKIPGLWIWLDEDMVNLDVFQILKYKPK